MAVSLSQKVTPEHVACWQFSSQIYAQPGVADQLLAAQARYQIWVNDWLFALWQAQHQRTVRPTFYRQLQQHQRWRQQVILPWRTQRQQAKKAACMGYRTLLSSELALEWCDQMTLALRARQLTEPTPLTAPSACLDQSIQRISAATPNAAERLQPILMQALARVTETA